MWYSIYTNVNKMHSTRALSYRQLFCRFVYMALSRFAVRLLCVFMQSNKSNHNEWFVSQYKADNFRLVIEIPGWQSKQTEKEPANLYSYISAIEMHALKLYWWFNFLFLGSRTNWTAVCACVYVTIVMLSYKTFILLFTYQIWRGIV